MRYLIELFNILCLARILTLMLLTTFPYPGYILTHLLVTLLLVPPLENDREGTPGQMVSAFVRKVIPAGRRK